MNTKRVIDEMDNWLERVLKVTPKKIDGENYATVRDIEKGSYAQLEHLKWMIEAMKELDKYSPDDSETREKLMRWIGFMQGALWSLGFASIDDFREMNTDE